MSYDELNDYEVISMALEENEDASRLLYSKYYPIFLKKSHKFLGLFKDKGIDFDDLIQECVIAFYMAINKFDINEDTCFYTFVNLCIDKHLLSLLTKANRLKNKFLNEAISLDSDDEDEVGLINLIGDDSLNPEIEFLFNEEVEELSSSILKTLTDLEECVFVLKIQGFTFNEIASILDKDEKSIYNSIQRIKNKIRVLFNKC